MPQATTHAPADLLTWADIAKASIGFAISLILIWAKGEGERLLRLRTLRRSAWNVAKNHTDFDEWLADLDQSSERAKDGSVWISSSDLSVHYSSIIAELSQLDPKNADTYLNYLSSEEVVRAGYRHLSQLKTEMIKARTRLPAPPDEAQSLRSAIGAQCQALRKDLLTMGKKELDVLRLIEVRHSDALNPIKQLERSLASLEKKLETNA